MEITGKIFQILPLREGVSQSTNNPWKMQAFLLETDDRYNNKLYFEIFGEQRINETHLHEGETVTVSFDINCREYNGSWFTALRVWKVVPANQSNQATTAVAATPTQPPTSTTTTTTQKPPIEEFKEEEGESTDLPF